MGIFPDARDLHPPTAQEVTYGVAEIDNLLERSAANYRDHRESFEQYSAAAQGPNAPGVLPGEAALVPMKRRSFR